MQSRVRTLSFVLSFSTIACNLTDRAATIDPGIGGPSPIGGAMDGSLTGDTGRDESGDAGTAIVVDGVLEESAWLSAASFIQNTSAAGTFFDGNGISRLRAIRVDTTLYLGIEGSLISSNTAIVALLDTDYGSGNGILYQGPLSNVTAQDFIDQVLVRGFQVIDTGFRPDFAWSTTTMPHARAVSAQTIGIRRLTTSPMFTRMSAGTISQCSESVCEVSFDVGSNGNGNGNGNIAIAVRLGNSQNLSNQTLPPDSPNNPYAIAQVLVLR